MKSKSLLKQALKMPRQVGFVNRECYSKFFLGMKLPCAGSIIALRGKDGKLLWKAEAYAEIFELLCHGIDVNQDGTDDCIATGRLADMRAINPKNGTYESYGFLEN